MIPRFWAIHLFLLGVFVGLQHYAWAQETLGLGQWRGYAGHGGEPRGALAADGRYYLLSSAGFTCYDQGMATYREYSSTDGLSNASPSAIGYVPAHNLVCIGYENGQIDLFQQPGDWVRVADIFRSTVVAVKTIQAFVAEGDLLYIATDFGLVGYDVVRGETRFSTRQISPLGPDRRVTHVALFQGRVYARLADGVFSAPTSGANLADPASWSSLSIHGSPNVPVALAATANRLVVVAGDSLQAFDGAAWAVIETGVNPLFDLGATPTHAWRVTNVDARLFDIQLTPIATAFSPEPRKVYYEASSATLALTDVQLGLRAAAQTGNSFETLVEQAPRLPFNGARRVAAFDGTVYVAPTGFVGAFGQQFSRAGVYAITPAANRYTVLSSTNGGLTSEVQFDFGTVARDPTTGDVWYGSWGDGIIQTRDGQLVASFTPTNSPLKGEIFNAGTGVCEIAFSGGLAFDGQGNLYVSTYYGGCIPGSGCCAPLQVRSPGGSWQELPVTGSSRWQHVVVSATTGFVYGVLDPVVSSSLGFVVYDPAGNPFNTANHRQRTLTAASGSGGLPSAQVFDVAEDRDGLLWVGTSNGVALYVNPFDFFSGEPINATLPIVEGFPLLRGSSVRAIAVDGANRKWFGTDQGIFVTSPAGDAILARFTTDNSPLPSNLVQDIAISGTTGEVFIATDEGLVGYRAEVTEPVADNTSPEVFPNPVYSDYTGPIAIRGLAEGTIVRLTDAAGRLVRVLRAQGGTVTWDGRDSQGRGVQSGVYLAYLARADGAAGGLAKIAFIRRN